MTRRCSHCSNNGHNSRTCPSRSAGGGGNGGSGSGGGGGGAGGGVRLFGVSLTTKGGSMKKSASMGCLSHYTSSSASAHASPNPSVGGDDSPPLDPLGDHATAAASGYASDDPNHASCSSNCRGERKKGIPWTEEEHRMFLVGLQKLGKGDWRGIARNYVVSRTPTQVASHAQKYFIRQTNATRRKRRSSLFDMVPDMPVDQAPALEEQFLLHSPPPEPEDTNMLPSLDLTLEQEPVPTETVADKPISEPEENVPCSNFPPIVPALPAFYPAYAPVPFAFWPSSVSMPVEEPPVGEVHVVLKPTPVLPKDPINVDELVGLSKLSLGEANTGRIEPSALSSKLLGSSSSRQSAFHVNPAVASGELSQSSSNAIHAV